MANRTRHLKRNKHSVVNILPVECFGCAKNWLLERSSLCQETESFRKRQKTKYEDDSVLTKRGTRTAGWTQEAYLAKWCIYWVQKTQLSRSRAMPLLLGTSGYSGPPGVVWNCPPFQASDVPIVFTGELTSNSYMQRTTWGFPDSKMISVSQSHASEVSRWLGVDDWTNGKKDRNRHTVSTSSLYFHVTVPVLRASHSASPGPPCATGSWEPIT